MCFAPQRRAIFGHVNFKKWPESVVFSTFWLANVLRATAACHFWTSNLQKVVRTRRFFHILTYKYPSRHSGVQFLNIATSKMAPGMWCFPHFDLQICFAPQRRAIFEHRNFQNGSGNVVFCAFWLANVLFATAACNFWTSQLPKWLRECGVLCILTCKCAFSPQPRGILEHRNFQNVSGAEVFSTFWRANVLRATAACHFSPVRSTATSAPAALAKLLFEHQEPRLIEKTQRFATSLTFGAHVELLATDSTRMLIFLLLTLHACWSSCYWLYTHVDLLATDMTAVRLCFSTLHIVGS